MLTFLYFGRLVQEKGCDLLIDMLRTYIQQKESDTNACLDQMQFVICGQGTYEADIRALADAHPHIVFHGRVDKKRIDELLSQAQYTLMPSRFLETFGLSALESLQHGVPVIGCRQGGLMPFISPQQDIFSYTGATLADKLYACIQHCLQKHTQAQRHIQQENARAIARKYTDRVRSKKFSSFLSTPQQKQTVVCISDFATQLGGIETYMYKVQTVLTEMGHSCHIVGLHISLKRYRLVQKVSLGATIANIYAAIQILRAIKKHRPTIIRRHSVTRRIGWLGLFCAKNKAQQQRMMYHDLGFFHPYPSKVYNQNQIPADWSLRSFLAAAPNKSIASRIAIVCKFISLSCIRKLLQKNIDIHFVPSDFMLPYLQNLYDIPADKTHVFPHFLPLS